MATFSAEEKIVTKTPQELRRADRALSLCRSSCIAIYEYVPVIGPHSATLQTTRLNIRSQKPAGPQDDRLLPIGCSGYDEVYKSSISFRQQTTKSDRYRCSRLIAVVPVLVIPVASVEVTRSLPALAALRNRLAMDAETIQGRSKEGQTSPAATKQTGDQQPRTCSGTGVMGQLAGHRGGPLLWHRQLDQQQHRAASTPRRTIVERMEES